ncbi:MAG: helix-turn-helix domain-containing protein [Candidatus Krumholzibacteriia bacterium]
MLDKRDLGMRIRRARKECGFTLKDLEGRARVSATHLSEIERGLTSPTIHVLVKISGALGRQPMFFLERNWLEPVRCTSLEHRMGPFELGEGVLATPLTGGIVGHRLSALQVRLAPGTSSEIEEPAHDGHETVLVNSGRVLVLVNGLEIKLEAGDSVHIRCGSPHMIRNASSVAAADLVWLADHRLGRRIREMAERSARTDVPRVA